MKFKEGDIIRLICDKESKPFIIDQIYEDRYYNKNGFYIEEENENDFEVIGNSKDYDAFVECRDDLYSIMQSMESACYKIKTIINLDPFDKENVKQLKEMYNFSLRKIHNLQNKLESLKDDFKELEK